ncbi:precorrin-2 dehydrogenase/sirohydrochlorin ferrochelatase family protein [Acidaminococcus massiliensis]
MSYFPLMIQLDRQPVLLVGGGRTALHKARILLAFGARLQVVAPVLAPGFQDLPVQVEKRKFVPDDIVRESWRMVVAATGERKINERVSRLCQERKIPVNVVDNPALCSFIFPALLKDREVVCAVSSGGRSPLVTQYVKTKIQQVLPVGLGSLNEQMGIYWQQVKAEELDPNKRRKLLQEKLRELVERLTKK